MLFTILGLNNYFYGNKFEFMLYIISAILKAYNHIRNENNGRSKTYKEQTVSRMFHHIESVGTATV